MESSRLGLHFRYVAGILVTLVVLLATRSYATDAQLVAYISFAATLASLLLAILAIIYSMTSNAGLSATLLAIQQSSGDLAARAREIAGMGKTISEIPAQIGELKKTFSAPATSEPAADLGVQTKDEFVTSFLGAGSANGLLALYAACWAAASSRPLVLSDVAALVKPESGLSFDYAYGYLVASASAGILWLRVVSVAGSRKTLKIKTPIDGLRERVKEAITARYQKDNSKWAQLIPAAERIEKHFTAPPPAEGGET
jgi:hypothetical protein